MGSNPIVPTNNMKILVNSYWSILKQYKKDEKPCGFCHFPFFTINLDTMCDGKIEFDLGLIGFMIQIII